LHSSVIAPSKIGSSALMLPVSFFWKIASPSVCAVYASQAS
jgi:hypothetical protein